MDFPILYSYKDYNMNELIILSNGNVKFEGSKEILIKILMNEINQELMNKAHNKHEYNQCPTCKQQVRINKDKQTDSSTKNLLNLYYLTKTQPENKWFPSSKFCKGRNGAGRFAALRHHGIISEMKPNQNNTNDGQKRNSGLWTLTDKGIQYCEGKITIPKYILTFNRQFIGTEGDQMHITDFLDETFNYNEIMNKLKS